MNIKKAVGVMVAVSMATVTFAQSNNTDGRVSKEARPDERTVVKAVQNVAFDMANIISNIKGYVEAEKAKKEKGKVGSPEDLKATIKGPESTPKEDPNSAVEDETGVTVDPTEGAIANDFIPEQEDTYTPGKVTTPRTKTTEEMEEGLKGGKGTPKED